MLRCPTRKKNVKNRKIYGFFYGLEIQGLSACQLQTLHNLLPQYIGFRGIAFDDHGEPAHQVEI